MTVTSPITTHVLDTSLGRPAANIAVTLEQQTNDQWKKIGAGNTNADGRLTDLLPPGSLAVGRYRLTFDVAEYFRHQNRPTFYPTVTVDFLITDPRQHHHVPLLLSPFGYSTYRGS